jgi:hypothetical protein
MARALVSKEVFWLWAWYIIKMKFDVMNSDDVDPVPHEMEVDRAFGIYAPPREGTQRRLYPLSFLG